MFDRRLVIDLLFPKIIDAASAATSVSPLALLICQEPDSRMRCSSLGLETLIPSKFGTVAVTYLTFSTPACWTTISLTLIHDSRPCTRCIDRDHRVIVLRSSGPMKLDCSEYRVRVEWDLNEI
jgi:hypothetical protein